MEATPAIRQPLSKERIFDAALRLGDEHGLEGLSMRRVARALGVEAMSLYNHVPNKAAIVSGILELVLTGIELPDRALPWAERLRALGRTMYRAIGGHPIVATIITTGVANPHTIDALRPIEEIYAALHQAGFYDRDATRGANALTALIFGNVLLRPARESTSEDDERERQWFQQNVSADELPHLHQALHAGQPADPTDFHYQLDVLVMGLEARSAVE
jgi:TetR/AcrR family tetracycline transcriptional repressor